MAIYPFIFQANADDSVTLLFASSPPPELEGGVTHLQRGDQICFSVLPLDNEDPMAQLVISFKSLRGKSPSPFDFKPTYTWNAGEALVDVKLNGRWYYTATLQTRSGKMFYMRDPELQVGDGSAE